MQKALITSRDPKGIHAVGLFEAAYNKAGLDEDAAQRLNEHGGEFQDGIANLITGLTRSNQFANEEVCSSYTYPPEYKGPKPIEAQVGLLLKYFPGLNPEPTFRFMQDVYPTLTLPDWVEGAFAVPNEHVLAEKFHAQIQGRLERYCASVRLVHVSIAGSRSFYNYREGQIVPAHLRRIQRTAEMIDRLVESQGGADIIVHFAQLGMRHRGRSVRRAREVFTAQEFGEGSLEVGAIALTHPERFVRWEQLHEDCAGDEFSPEAGGKFDRAPDFFLDGGVKFDTFWTAHAYGYYGSVSAFLPQ